MNGTYIQIRVVNVDIQACIAASDFIISRKISVEVPIYSALNNHYSGQYRNIVAPNTCL